MRCRPSWTRTGPLWACTLALLGGCAAMPLARKPEPPPAATSRWPLIYRIAGRTTLRGQTGAERSLDVIWRWRWD